MTLFDLSYITDADYSLEIILMYLNRLHLTTKNKDKQLNDVIANITNTLLKDLKLQHRNMLELTDGKKLVKEYSGILQTFLCLY